MSKVLKVAAVVVGVAALAVATAGIGAGATLASVSTLGVTSTMAAGASLFGLSAATLSTIAGGLSLASSLTAKRPSLGSSGTQTQFKADPNAPIPYAIGRTFVAGNIVHQASSGTNNELLHFAIIWSGGGPIDSFEAFKVDGATVTFGAGGAAIGAYAGFMWLKTQLGAAPEAAALSPGSGSMPGWGASSKLSGYAAGLWTLKYDKKGKVFTAGVPKAGMVAKWTRVYDPRKDSTYPGGSGAHRPLVETTYEWSDSPWLNALTWAMGRLQNGQFVLGARQKFDSIDVAAFVEAANVAQANGWKAGGLVTSADDPWQVLKAMCQAGGGEPIRIGAMLSCIVNTPRVSLGTITALDLAGPASVTATQARRDRINGVIGKYRSEDHDWELVDAAPVRIDAYVTFDGRRRTRPITYPLVQCFAGQQPVQVAQLAAYDIYNAREIPAIVTPLKIRFVGVKPGDCWTLDIPEAGLNNQLCMLRQRSLDVAKGVPTLTWRSETTGKHDAALGKTTTPPPTPTLGLIDLSNVPAPAVGAWTATGTALTANGVSVPAIVISGAVENPAAEAVVIEYRPTGSPAWINASTEDANLVKFELDRVTSGTDYDIAISYRVRNVVGARRVLGPVTTGDWEGIEGPAGPPGLDGNDGLPGAPGADGQTSYVHFAYANSADGTVDFTTGAPAGRYYVGVYTDFTAADSTTPGDYTWSLQRGADGANGTPGAPGADGSATYVHIAYATAADGSTGFSTTDGAGKTYIGTYTDGTLADSTNPAVYTWSLIKGADGQNGLTFSLTKPSIDVAADYLGNAKSEQFPITLSCKLMSGGTDVSGSAAFTVPETSGNNAAKASALVVSISSVTASGYFDVRCVYGSLDQTIRVPVNLIKDQTPAQQGAAQQTTNDLGSFAKSTTSYPASPRYIMTIRADGSGQINFAWGFNYQCPPPATLGTRSARAAAKPVYRIAGSGGAWLDAASEIIGSNAIGSRYEIAPGEQETSQTTGVCQTAAGGVTKTGLSAGGDYEVGLMIRNAGTDGAPSTYACTGAFTAKQP